MEISNLVKLQNGEFSSKILDSFQELRGVEELLDVTLACRDKTFEAHKLVLSAGSLFFRRIFSKMKQSKPLVYLKGIQESDLKAILDFLYTGEATIPADNVNTFIEVAQELEIKGLSEVDDSLEVEFFDFF